MAAASVAVARPGLRYARLPDATQVSPWITCTPRTAKNVVASIRSTPGRALTNGVVLPWPTARLVRILAGVYPADLPLTVTLAAPDALSLAGLRRVVSLAGLRENNDGAPIAMSLRHQGCGAPHTTLDVEIGDHSIVVHFSRSPAPEAWRCLYAVLTILIPGVDNSAQTGNLGWQASEPRPRTDGQARAQARGRNLPGS